MKINYLSLLLAGLVYVPAMQAADVTVTMNNISKTMTLESVASGEKIEVGEPERQVYKFSAPAGEYILSGFAGETLNGTIRITVDDSEGVQEFKILTCTVYATNKNSDNSVWTIADGDYTLDVVVNSREGLKQEITLGNSTTANRATFLALNGNSSVVEFIPSERHRREGYTSLYKMNNLTFNSTISGVIPMGENYVVDVPAAARFSMGMKKSHFVDFIPVEPQNVQEKDGNKQLTFYLAQSQVYNFRTWIDGGVTYAGYFNMGTRAEDRPRLAFTEADYKVYNPGTINHDPASNKGYETGNIFVNVNERGHLVMNQGQTFRAHAMRSWELTDNTTNNYFIEPDFHYAVLDLHGRPCDDVISISQSDGSSWAEIKAIGNGEVIVLVTYDAIALDYYNKANKTEYLGGEFWGAVWPENTAAYVVTVGQDASSVNPCMFINEGYNDGAKKMAGDNVDAEHDIFYYLDTEEGAAYTFTPEGVSEVTIAYPVISESKATYNGFGKEGVTKNDDGSYTLLLRHGRQIVKLADASGNSVYQILTAKKCHREIINETHPESEYARPGDRIRIQYSGLHHPANKLAGIYNMSAYVTYKGIPNGTSLIQSSGQYTFGSAPKAQAVTVTIPEDYDAEANPEFILNEGVIQVNGFGDPIGNHRFIDPVAGRSPNFTAIAHKTYFGAVPDIRIPVTVDGNSAVDEVEMSDVIPVVYYNLQGVASETPHHGLNIVRMSDGSHRKVIY